MGCIPSHNIEAESLTMEAEYRYALRIDSPNKGELREAYHQQLQDKRADEALKRTDGALMTAFDMYVEELKKYDIVTPAAIELKDYYLQLKKSHDEKFSMSLALKSASIRAFYEIQYEHLFNFWATIGRENSSHFVRTPSKRSSESREQTKALTKRAANYYGVLRNCNKQEKSFEVECCLSGTIGNGSRVRLTHLLPASCNQQQYDMFGVANDKDYRNIVFWAINIKTAFDKATYYFRHRRLFL